MKPKISIIVPIYNVEKYLSKCIESILNQTLTNFELILVNDGSEDKCKEICETYAKKDCRIKVINKENGGVSSARNIGMKVSTGEYLAFVDPDDDIEEHMYENMFYFAEKEKIEMVISSFTYIDIINNSIKKQDVYNKCPCIIYRDEIEKKVIPSLLRYKDFFEIYACWNKLYKRDVIIQNGIKFDESKNHGEDAKFNLELLNYIKTLGFINESLYNYYIRDEKSLSKIIREDFYNYILDNKKIHEALCNRYNYSELKSFGINNFMNATIQYMIEISKSEIEFNKKLKILENIMKSKEFKKNIYGYKCPYKYYKFLKRACINETSLVFILLIKILVLKDKLNDRVS